MCPYTEIEKLMKSVGFLEKCFKSLDAQLEMEDITEELHITKTKELDRKIGQLQRTCVQICLKNDIDPEDTDLIDYGYMKEQDELIDCLGDIVGYYPKHPIWTEIEELKRNQMARRIQRRWIEIYYSPYTEIGRRRLEKEARADCAELNKIN